MEKTIREWLSELPEPYRSLALKYHREFKCEKMTIALLNAFDFDLTDEGFDFWDDVCLHFSQGSPLPELPKDES